MPTLTTRANDLTLPNPFVIGSGPPSTNANVIRRAMKAGWGGVVCKTVCLDAKKIANVYPRYARIRSRLSNEIYGWQNIELISDRPFDAWLDEFKQIKDASPEGVLIASVMEQYNKDAWTEIVERCQETGVDALELNLSCPHGLPERQMGAAIGESPEACRNVVDWVMRVARVPVWAKMTPNVTRIENPVRAALAAGCDGISAINTIRAVAAVNLDSLRPEPNVMGYSTPGGLSSIAVRPIALRICMEIARLIEQEFPGRSLSGIGGIESGEEAAQFILLGAHTVQVCTGVMKYGYELVESMKDSLLAFMEKHNFECIRDFRGHSLAYFTSHSELVELQSCADEERETLAVPGDEHWSGEKVVEQSNSLARG